MHTKSGNKSNSTMRYQNPKVQCSTKIQSGQTDNITKRLKLCKNKSNSTAYLSKCCYSTHSLHKIENNPFSNNNASCTPFKNVHLIRTNKLKHSTLTNTRLTPNTKNSCDHHTVYFSKLHAFTNTIPILLRPLNLQIV